MSYLKHPIFFLTKLIGNNLNNSQSREYYFLYVVWRLYRYLLYEHVEVTVFWMYELSWSCGTYSIIKCQIILVKKVISDGLKKTSQDVASFQNIWDLMTTEKMGCNDSNELKTKNMKLRYQEGYGYWKTSAEEGYTVRLNKYHACS